MHIGWPQGILLALLLLGMGIHLARDGQPMNNKYNFLGNLSRVSIIVALLYWGGFFTQH